MEKYKEVAKEHQEEMIQGENLRIQGVVVRKVVEKIRGVGIGRRGSKNIKELEEKLQNK